MIRNCIITGATNGIGKQAAIDLAKKGFSIILIGRDKLKCNSVAKEIVSITSNENVTYFIADLSIMSDILKLSEKIKNKYSHIDVLVNNAGAYFNNYIETAEGFEKTFALNHLAYYYFTKLLKDIINEGPASRVVNVASSAHFGAKLDLDDIQNKNKNYRGWLAYSNSKLMNILFTYELHRRYNNRSTTFNCLHPGFVYSKFGDNNTGFAKKILTIGKKLLAIDLI